MSDQDRAIVIVVGVICLSVVIVLAVWHCYQSIKGGGDVSGEV